MKAKGVIYGPPRMLFKIAKSFFSLYNDEFSFI